MLMPICFGVQILVCSTDVFSEIDISGKRTCHFTFLCVILSIPLYAHGKIGTPSKDPYTLLTNRHRGSVVERPLCDREVADSIPGRVIPKTLKMVLAALSLGAQH